MNKKKTILVLSAFVFLLFLFLPNGVLLAWSKPITVAASAGTYYYKPVVAVAPGGKIYVAYQAGRELHLSSFNGSTVQFEMRLNNSSLQCYEAFMSITRRGTIHVVWIEAASYAADTQYLNYRYYNGSSWSAISTLRTMNIPGTLPGGYVSTKVEDLRIAADENNNVFIAFMIWPEGRCVFYSKYGGTVAEETWPMKGRSKHPDVVADANYVHVAWQQLWGSTYTVAYSRRANRAGAAWGEALNVRDGNHRPRMSVDSSNLLHYIMMNDYNLGMNRDTYYKYWTGSGFSSRFLISNDAARAFHCIEVNAVNSANIFFSEFAGNTVYFNWKQNGSWTGHKVLPTSGIRPIFTSSALSSAGVAVVAVADSASAVYLIWSQGETPGPTPPPEPDPNKPPKAAFTFSPASGLYPLTVAFNAGKSTDSDGTIVSFDWNYGDGGKGSGKNDTHVYDSQGVFTITLRVTDDDGATATATGQLEVFGVAPPLNLAFQRHENRNLFSVEYLYRITWKHNPRNDQIGSKIANYKIFRREVGRGGFAHFYTLPAGNYTEFEYLDRTLGSTPRAYEYAVSSVDTAGRESPQAQ